MNDDKLISLQDAAKISGLSASFLRARCQHNEIPHEKIGSQYAVRLDYAGHLYALRQPPKGFITIQEAAQIAGVSKTRIYALLHMRKIRSESRFLFKRYIRWIERASLEQWMRGRENATNH